MGKNTTLVPGGTAYVQPKAGVASTRVTADVQPLLGLVAILVAAIDEILATTGIKISGSELRDIGECGAGIIDIFQNPDPGSVLRTLLDCFGKVVTGPAQIVVSLLTSLTSLLITQIVGIAGELTGTNHLTIDISQTRSAISLPASFPKTWTVHGGGLTIGDKGTARSIGHGSCGNPGDWCNDVMEFNVVPITTTSIKLIVTKTYSEVSSPTGGTRYPPSADATAIGDYFILKLQPDGSALTTLYSPAGTLRIPADSPNNLGNPWLCQPNGVRTNCGA
jgi:hypothetical protein